MAMTRQHSTSPLSPAGERLPLVPLSPAGERVRVRAASKLPQPGPLPLPWPRVFLLFGLVLVLAGCGRQHRDVLLAPPTAEPTGSSALAPIEFPRDDGPHSDLTEWWYYTGHLASDDGRSYGFELVFFQTVRGEYPVAYFG